MPKIHVAGWKTEHGRAEYVAAYDAAMALWPVAFETRHVETRFGSTHVIVSGRNNAEPLLALHAATGFGATQWYPNAATISAHNQVFAADFIGSAGKGRQTASLLSRSDCANWVADVMDALQLERAHLIGSSQGGWLALNFTLQYPDRTHSLALIAPAAAIVPIRPLMRMFIKLGPYMPAWTGPPSIKGMFGGRVEVDERIVRLLTLHLAHFRYQHRAVFPTAFPEAELQKLVLPVLFLIGDKEVIYRPERALALARRLFPRVEAELVQGAGHLINMEKPEFVSERLLRFFREHPAG